MNENGFTKTEQAMLDVLSDGKHHTRQELHACLPDELGQLSAIQRHLSCIRTKLQKKNQDIVCTLYKRSICYRWMLLLPTSQVSKV